jgi:hypothetical protein
MNAQSPASGDIVPAGAPDGAQQALTQEIERTREELGQTVEALAAKADVKARAQDATAELTARVRGTAAEFSGRLGRAGRDPRVPLAAAAGATLVSAWAFRRWLSR